MNVVGNRRNWHALNWETDEQIGRKRTRWRWRRLSTTLPRTSRCATTALQRGSKSSTLTDRGKVRIGVTRNAMSSLRTTVIFDTSFEAASFEIVS